MYNLYIQKFISNICCCHIWDHLHKRGTLLCCSVDPHLLKKKTNYKNIITDILNSIKTFESLYFLISNGSFAQIINRGKSPNWTNLSLWSFYYSFLFYVMKECYAFSKIRPFEVETYHSFDSNLDNIDTVRALSEQLYCRYNSMEDREILYYHNNEENMVLAWSNLPILKEQLLSLIKLVLESFSMYNLFNNNTEINNIRRFIAIR